MDSSDTEVQLPLDGGPIHPGPGDAISSALAHVNRGSGSVVAVVCGGSAQPSALLQFASRSAAAAGALTIDVSARQGLDIHDLYERIAKERGANRRPVVITVDQSGDLDPVTRAIVAAAQPTVVLTPAVWVVAVEEAGEVPPAASSVASIVGESPKAPATPFTAERSSSVLAVMREYPQELRASALLGQAVAPGDVAALVDRPVAALATFFRDATAAGVFVEDADTLRFADASIVELIRARQDPSEGEPDVLVRRLVDRYLSGRRAAALADGVRAGRLELRHLDPQRALAACEAMSSRDPGVAAVATRQTAERMLDSERDAAMARAATFTVQSGDAAALRGVLTVLEGGAGPAATFAVAEATFAAFTDAASRQVERSLARRDLGPVDRARLSALALAADTYRGMATDRQRADAGELVRQTGDGRAEALLRLSLALFEGERGDLGGALRQATLRIPLPDGADSGPAWWMAAIYRTRLLADLGRVPEAEAFLLDAIGAATSKGQARAIPSMMMMTGILRMEAGNLRSAVTHLEGARQLADGMGLAGLVETNCVHLLTHLHRMTGDLVRLHELRDALVARIRDDEARRDTAAVALTFADDALGEDASPDVEPAIAPVALRRYWIARGLADVVSSFRFAHQVGDDSSVRRHHETVQILASTTESSLLRATALHCRGVVDAEPDAIRDAQAAYVDLGRPILAAQAGEDIALATEAASGREEALKDAASAWNALGASREAARIELLLRDMGSRQPHAETILGLGLSAAEERVVRAVLAGATNQQTARSLFISPNTVAVHLSRVYARVGVRSRAELIDLVRHTSGREA